MQTSRGVMRHVRAIATDYDDTIAQHGIVPQATLQAMERFRASGRMLILNTGRGLEDLIAVFPDLSRFDRVLVENGAVLFFPSTGEERLLAEPLPERFFEGLRRRGVFPIPPRRVILDTRAVYKEEILDAMRELDQDLHLVFNNESVLVAPHGVHKGSGLRHALDGTGITPEQTAGIGDAGNDLDLLDACGAKIAVPHAIPALLKRADSIMTFTQLVDAILIQ